MQQIDMSYKGDAMSEPSSPAASSAGLPKLKPLLVLCGVGLALFLSSMWTARADASGVSTEVVYATRFVSLATYLFMAWCFRSRLPQVELVLGLGCSFMLVHLASVLAGPLLGLDASISLIVDYLSGMFEGVANALITLVFAHIFSSYEPRKSAFAIGVAYLLVDVGILVLDTMSVAVIHYARPLFTLAAVGIVFFSARRLLDPASAPELADRSLRHAEQLPAPEGKDRTLALFSAHNDWFLLLITAFLFPSLFGVIAQVSSETGGNFALYDIPTEIVMIAMQAFFLLYMAFCGERFGFAAILAFIIPLYATGFALFPGNWASDNPFAGCLIRAGFVILAVLLWALMARKSYDDPRHTYLYFGVYCGISNGQVGRLVGTMLMGQDGPNLALCQNISLAALWSICIFGLVLFFLLRRAGMGTASAAADGDGFATLGELDGRAERWGTAGDLAANVGGVDLAAGGFAAQFDALAVRCRLTAREREVVLEALHGYSRTNIAKKLCLSPETVKTYLNRAYAKAGVTSKQELVAAIEREGL